MQRGVWPSQKRLRLASTLESVLETTAVVVCCKSDLCLVWSALTGGVIVVPAPPAEGGPRAQRGHRAIVCKKCCMLCVLHIED